MSVQWPDPPSKLNRRARRRRCSSGQVLPPAQRDAAPLQGAAHAVGAQRGQLFGAVIGAALGVARGGVGLGGVADELVIAGAKAPDDLEDADLVEVAALDVAPALRSAAQ